MITNNNTIISIHAEDAKVEDKIMLGEDESRDSGTLTSNPESTAFLLDLDEEDNRSQDLESSSSSDGEENRAPEVQRPETFWSILVQIILPFFLAGCGTVGAGLILDKVHYSRVFQEVPQIIILVPALLGLKGNIEMTLASRLSTEANMGRLNSTKSIMRHVLGNIYLVQFQAIAVGLLASVSPYWMGSPPESIRLALLLSASSVMTTSLASLILGVLMSTIVVISHKHNINPDNIAAPLAASIGDIVTLTFLFLTSFLIYDHMRTLPWLAPTILGIYVCSLPLWFYLAYREKCTRKVLMAASTWFPILAGVVISCLAGIIFEHSVKMFKKIAVLQPVMNGVGGNIAAVQSSRISTYLHCNSKRGSLPKDSDHPICVNPMQTFYNGIHAKSAWALLFLLIPGHLIFVAVIGLVHSDLHVSMIFISIYILAAVVQVLILLYLVDILVSAFWRFGIDPDNAATPCLTSIADLLGTTLLVMAFQIIYFLQPGDIDEGIVAYLNSIN